MADEIKVIEGTLGTAEATLYTVPALKAFIITERRLTNKTGTSATATLKVGTDTVIFPSRSIPANDANVEQCHTPVLTGMTIKGAAGTATAIDYYISGIEVDV